MAKLDFSKIEEDDFVPPVEVIYVSERPSLREEVLCPACRVGCTPEPDQNTGWSHIWYKCTNCSLSYGEYVNNILQGNRVES